MVCNKETGDCKKNPGVTGDKADRCMVNHFNFTKIGCQECQCDSFGSVSSQCDLNGRCKCRSNIDGQKCDKCKENYSNFTLGCVKCNDCYDLVEKQVRFVRTNLTVISESLDRIDQVSVDDETKEKNQELATLFKSVSKQVEDLHAELFSGETFISFNEKCRNAKLNSCDFTGIRVKPLFYPNKNFRKFTRSHKKSGKFLLNLLILNTPHR